MTLSRRRVRRRRANVLAKPKITFAMIELADPKDCNDRKRLWKRLKFQDITPEVAARAKVPSLNGRKTETIGLNLIQGMKSVNAHWYLLSGHHGRLYSDDMNRFKNSYDYFSQQDYAGFFNNEYHHGRWIKLWRDPARIKQAADALANPDWRDANKKMAKHFDYELYLTTTAEAPDSITGGQFDQVNPLLVSRMQPRRSSKCLGIILSACNTLSFSAVRKYWQSNYPNSVIFGTFRTIGHGYQVTNAIARAKLTNAKFWRQPSDVLVDEGVREDLVMQIARKFPRSRREFGIGIIYDGKVYVSRLIDGKNRVDEFAAGADLPRSKEEWPDV